MKTNQLPPHTITIHDHPEPNIMQWSDLELAAVKRYAEQYALQARAQVQGEPFGYIHHFAAHDESGALIDTTWEADGCADPLPHPTSPSMWKWTHCTPFYTTQQPTQAAQAEAQRPATTEPVDFPAGAIVNGRTLMDRIEAYPFESEGGDLRMCSGWHELRRCFEHLADYVSPHPEPSVRADAVRDAISTVREHYRGTDWGKAAESICDAIDAAMLAAKEGTNGKIN